MGIAIQKVDNLAYWLDRLNSQIASMNISVKDPSIGAKGDGASVTDGAITSGQATLTSVSRPATSSDVGKTVLVVGAGAAYNNLGAWAPSTAYTMGDLVTWSGYSWTVQVAHTSGSFFAPSNWSKVTTTTRALTTTVSSVAGGVYTLAANASTTVTGATVYIASDDSTPFQNAINAAYNAGGGTVYVPSGMYTLAGVYVKSNVRVAIDDGTTLRPVPTSTGSLFYMRNANAAVQCVGAAVVGPYWTFDCTGIDPVRGTSPVTTRSTVAVYVQGASDYTIEGCVGVNLPLGNIVQNENTSGGLRPTNGRIGRLRIIDGPYGYGCVQIDDGNHISVYDLYSNGPSYCCNVETDDPSSGPARVAENIQVRNCVTDSAYGATISNTCCQVAAHAQTIRCVQFYGIRSTGGQNGFAASYTVGSGSADHILVDGLYVSGGGWGLTTGTNTSYTDFVVKDFFCDGTNSTNLSNSLPNNCMTFAPGMVLENGTVQNCLGHGYDAVYWDGTVWPSYGNLPITLRNCRAYACGTPGGTYYGIRNQYAPTIIIDSCDIQDNPVVNLMPAALRDCQNSNNPFWNSVSGTGSRTRVPKTGVQATGTITSDGTEIADGDTVTIGTITYRFKDTLAQAYDVKRDGTTATNTLNNLVSAIGLTGTVGTTYYAGTYQHPDVSASRSSSVVTLTARYTGAVGNLIALSKSASHLSVSGSVLSGGVTPGSWYTSEFVTADGTANGIGISSPFHSAGNQYMVPVVAGQTYKFDAWAIAGNSLAEAAVATKGINLQCQLSFYNDNGDAVSTTGLSQQQSINMSPGGYTYAYAIKAAPAGATYCQYNVSITHVSGRGNPSPGESYYIVPGAVGRVFTTVTTSGNNIPQMTGALNLSQGMQALISNSRLTGGSVSTPTLTINTQRISGSGFARETFPQDPGGLALAVSTQTPPQQWQKFTISYKDLTGWAATTGNALVYALPIKGIIHAAYFNVTTAFAGTTTLTATLGTASSNAAYQASTDLMATGVTAGVTGLAMTPASLTGSTQIQLYATSTGANLSSLSAGSVDIYVLTSQSP